MAVVNSCRSSMQQVLFPNGAIPRSAEMLCKFSRKVSSLKQQLGPAFLAAAAAGNVETGKVLLSYCPDLLEYALWNCPAVIKTFIIDDKRFIRLTGSAWLPNYMWTQGPFKGGLLLFASQLHRAGFKGLKLEERVSDVLVELCRHNQRHQPESVQMLLDLGVVSSNQIVEYCPEIDVRPRKYFKAECTIIAVAVAEQNAGAVAVLLAAGAVLPALEVELYNLPFDYSDLQAVLEELEQQAAAEGGEEMALIHYGAAVDAVRAYCEQHGQEKIDANAFIEVVPEPVDDGMGGI